jgi:hypothetical protein
VAAVGSNHRVVANLYEFVPCGVIKVEDTTMTPHSNAREERIARDHRFCGSLPKKSSPAKSASLAASLASWFARSPPEVEKFFDAIEAGNWDSITNQWRELAVHSSQYEYSTNHWEQLDQFWPSVLDAYGVAEQAHLWPAQKLLDYGNAIMGALRLVKSRINSEITYSRIS